VSIGIKISTYIFNLSYDNRSVWSTPTYVVTLYKKMTGGDDVSDNSNLKYISSSSFLGEILMDGVAFGYKKKRWQGWELVFVGENESRVLSHQG